MRSFDIPEFYRSPIISKVKELRKSMDPRKKDFTPTELDFGELSFMLARHFGFCYGVENAIEISYRALNDHPNKRVYLLSQMIHNPQVNADLLDRGARFLQDTYGKQLIPFEEVTPDDIVIIPAFGTTLEIEHYFEQRGVEVQKYNTTCPFVEKVWKRSQKLGAEAYTIVIHGKPKHEETRATFSHASADGPAVVVLDMEESKLLERYVRKELPSEQFFDDFAGQFSQGFNPEKDLERIGVVNQTTMLASDTQAIADHLKDVMLDLYGAAALKSHFADTRDTLCYATNDNQQATYGLLEHGADLAIVVGGYNSSNTSHLVELCEEKMPTFFIQTEEDILSSSRIRHFDIHSKAVIESIDFLPQAVHPKIIVTSGASCPDAIVDRVLQRILSFYEGADQIDEVLASLTSM